MTVMSQTAAEIPIARRIDEFDALFQEYRLRAFHFALQILNDREDAMDVTQEAFLRVHRNWARRDRSRPFAPWLFSIVRNLCIDFLRKRASRSETDSEDLVIESPNPGPESLASKGQVKTRVWQAISQLPEPQREVLVLRDLHGFSYKEISSIISESTTTVNSRLHDARQTLRRRLRGLL